MLADELLRVELRAPLELVPDKQGLYPLPMLVRRRVVLRSWLEFCTELNLREEDDKKLDGEWDGVALWLLVLFLLVVPVLRRVARSLFSVFCKEQKPTLAPVRWG